MRRITSIFSLLLFFSGFATADDLCRVNLEPAKATSELKKVSDTYSTVSSLSAKFEQSSFFLGLGDKVVSSGELRFKRPGKMDWSYKTPEEQRFVADGTSIWFFQPDLNQVTVGNFENTFSSDLPVSFLLGVGQLEKAFQLERACISDKGTTFFLKPNSEDPNLRDFVLYSDPKTHLPAGAKITDVGGNETEIILSNVRPGVSLPDSDFTFVIPKGVDVINHRFNSNALGGGSSDETSVVEEKLL